jgi:transcriptional regulator with XRE-family HTH domain
MSNDIGQRIRELRKRLKYTQKQLAKKLGVSDTTVSAYEVGDAMPTVTTLKKLTEIADVSFDWLCAGSFMVQDPENKLIQLTPEELRLLKKFRKASKEQKDLLSRLADALVDDSKNKTT